MSDLAVLGHTVFVTAHALAATAALVSGVVTAHTGRGFGLHQTGVVAMAATLGPSLAFGWPGFPPTARVTFLRLAGLALFMVLQSVRARRVRGREAVPPGQPVGPKFVRVLGFNLIALTVAGTVVPVLRVGGGALGIAVAVAVTVILGHVLVERRVRGVLRAPRVSTCSLARARGDRRPATSSRSSSRSS